jgi:hypothetical protein
MRRKEVLVADLPHPLPSIPLNNSTSNSSLLLLHLGTWGALLPALGGTLRMSGCR